MITNKHTERVLGKGNVTAIYAWYLVVIAMGFLSYALFARHKGEIAYLNDVCIIY